MSVFIFIFVRSLSVLGKLRRPSRLLTFVSTVAAAAELFHEFPVPYVLSSFSVRHRHRMVVFWDHDYEMPDSDKKRGSDVGLQSIVVEGVSGELGSQISYIDLLNFLMLT